MKVISPSRGTVSQDARMTGKLEGNQIEKTVCQRKMSKLKIALPLTVTMSIVLSL